MENLYLLNSEIREALIIGNYFTDLEKISIISLNESTGVLNKLIDTTNKVQDFITKVINILRDRLSSVLSSSTNKLKDKLKANSNFVSKLQELKNNSTLLSELDLCKNVAKFYKESFIDKFISSIKTNLISSLQLKENVDAILESDMENKNKIVNIANKLSHIPPFSWLHNIQKLGEKTATNIVSVMSDITNKLGGPSFTLPVICALLGIAFEMNVKGLIKAGIIDMISYYSIPFISLPVKFIGLVATFIAVVDIVDEITTSKTVREH
jgi:hypothetical protein